MTTEVDGATVNRLVVAVGEWEEEVGKPGEVVLGIEVSKKVEGLPRAVEAEISPIVDEVKAGVDVEGGLWLKVHCR